MRQAQNLGDSETVATQGKRSVGRPTIWTEEMKIRMFDLISTGSGISEIAGKNGFPAACTIYRLMAEDAEFATCIARAREAQQEHEMDYCIQLADSATPEDWNVKKLQIWARQWRASKLAPKKWGDKPEVVINNNNTNATQNVVNLSPDQEASLQTLIQQTRDKVKK